jgi:hypothetical protein
MPYYPTASNAFNIPFIIIVDEPLSNTARQLQNKPRPVSMLPVSTTPSINSPASQALNSASSWTSSLGPSRPYVTMPQTLPDVEKSPNGTLLTHDLFSHQASKIYICGFLNKKVELTTEGRQSNSKEWVSVYAELAGCVLRIYNIDDFPAFSPTNTVPDIEKIKATLSPTYINVQDSTVTWVGTLRKEVTSFLTSNSALNAATSAASDRHFCFALNSAGANRYYLQAGTDQAGQDWVCAIRLSCYEFSKLSQLWTRDLLAMDKYKKDIESISTNPKLEDFLQIRFSGVTEWKKFWVTLETKGVCIS